MTYRIVVGVDGSPHSDAAVRWAIEEAEARHGEVTAVFAWQLPFLSFPGAFDRDELEQASKEFIVDNVSRIVKTPPVPLTTLVAEGDPAASLDRSLQGGAFAGGGHPGPVAVVRAAAWLGEPALCRGGARAPSCWSSCQRGRQPEDWQPVGRRGLKRAGNRASIRLSERQPGPLRPTGAPRDHRICCTFRCGRPRVLRRCPDRDGPPS